MLRLFVQDLFISTTGGLNDFYLLTYLEDEAMIFMYTKLHQREQGSGQVNKTWVWHRRIAPFQGGCSSDPTRCVLMIRKTWQFENHLKKLRNTPVEKACKNLYSILKGITGMKRKFGPLSNTNEFLNQNFQAMLFCVSTTINSKIKDICIIFITAYFYSH